MNCRKGYTLILAIVLVGAVGVTAGILAAQSRNTLRVIQSADLEIRAAGAIAAGQAWSQHHVETVRTSPPDWSIELPTTDLAPPGGTASLRIARMEGSKAIRITARMQRGNQTCSIEIEQDIPPAG
jgi:hypothetical protein